MHPDQLNLTEKDFDLIIDGLDFLPERGSTGDILGEMLTAMILKGDNEGKEKMLRERERKQREKNEGQRILREDIKILQGKLLLLKRYLMQEGALKGAEDIINKPID